MGGLSVPLFSKSLFLITWRSPLGSANDFNVLALARSFTFNILSISIPRFFVGPPPVSGTEISCPKTAANRSGAEHFATFVDDHLPSTAILGPLPAVAIDRGRLRTYMSIITPRPEQGNG